MTMPAQPVHDNPVAQVLAAHHSDISEQEVAEVLRKALDEAVTDAPLTAAEESFIREHAGVALERPDVVRIRRNLTGLLQAHTASTASLSTAEAAALCGISESRMRHLIADGEAYVLPVSGRVRRLPLWQFTTTRLLPHLREVLAALPAEMPTAVLEAFMTQPAEDLQNDGEPVSIAAWLAAGGAPAIVLELAASENASR